ncbi:MAG: lipopolysaccharide/colanic/teichoic acid biosynthesis glycosyltransferase [Paraglaciecola sp.]|jgi:lipopolysaccharide/colanic/teichoic acid biosynthesis glycosyltransferase
MIDSIILSPTIDQKIYASKQAKANQQEKVMGKHNGIPMFMQRSAALIALVILSPLLLIAMLLIRLESTGSCFYSQDRIGKYGRHFKMYKFRSMYLKTDSRYSEPDPSSSDRDGICKKYKNDPRISTVGSFIRKFSIDELPQLINIVKGDMALIGPRPALAIEVNAYPTSALCRLNGMPGLSGLWQVSGRADTDFDTQVKLDDRYLQQQSIGFDIKILLATLPCVIGAKGAY